MELDRITLEYERRIHMPEQSASRRCKRQHEQHDERRKNLSERHNQEVMTEAS